MWVWFGARLPFPAARLCAGARPYAESARRHERGGGPAFTRVLEGYGGVFPTLVGVIGGTGPVSVVGAAIRSFNAAQAG